MKRTAQFIESTKSANSIAGNLVKRKGKPRGKPFEKGHNLGFKKGKSGNPTGKPGTDLAALAARRFFERHPEGTLEEMNEELKGFNAYGFGVLADRGYGKVKEETKHEITGELAIKITMVD